MGAGVVTVDGETEEGLGQAVQEGYKVVRVRLPTSAERFQGARVGPNPVVIIEGGTG